jgi:16S rRNA (guanine527-N7)-methyltransferase
MQYSSPLLEALGEAQRLGLLGPRPLQEHIEAVLPLVALLPPQGRVADLGAGGGIPGLVLAAELAETTWVLLDRRQACCDFLTRMVTRLGLGDRAQVVCADASDVGRRPDWRASFDSVVSRGFARPAVMLECAAPLLRLGGQVLVTARADDAEWPGEPDILERLGLAEFVAGEDPHVRAARQVRLCPPEFPRRRRPTS